MNCSNFALAPRWNPAEPAERRERIEYEKNDIWFNKQRTGPDFVRWEIVGTDIRRDITQTPSSPDEKIVNNL